MTSTQIRPSLAGSAPGLDRWSELALRGLAASYQASARAFPQTVRGVPSPDGPTLQAEGLSPRYTAIAALGLARRPLAEQRAVLAGSTAAELARRMVELAAENTGDPGLVALAAWALAEVDDSYAAELFAHLAGRLDRGEPIPTVDLAWTLTAAVAALDLGPSADLARAAATRLMAGQAPSGTFGHQQPDVVQSRLRRHVGSFADQVYPIQALARWSQFDGPAALVAAERVAAVIIARQGDHGQWWWHYDVRDGSVVEGFPVYSVHQHAMGPMALDDLQAAGGPDHREAVERGRGWLSTHPEVVDELVQDRLGVIWRKVGRRERAKAVRRASAVTTAVRRGWHLPALDRVSPPGPIDHECRPYELGWLLYAESGPNGQVQRS